MGHQATISKWYRNLVAGAGLAQDPTIGVEGMKLQRMRDTPPDMQIMIKMLLFFLFDFSALQV